MIVGVGGVGGFAAEAVARAGVGFITLVDFDQVCITNVNRQIHALRRTVGASKVALMADRCRAINPKATVVAEQCFFSAETSGRLLAPGFDFVIDAIDNVTAKIHLLAECVSLGQPVVSAMGAGGRTDPTRMRVTDISRTAKDPLARVVRKNLKDRGIDRGIECVWTDEEPNALDSVVEDAFHCICPSKENDMHTCEDRNLVQGTVPWMPAMFGMALAGVVVNRMLGRPVLSADREPPEHTRKRARRSRLFHEGGLP